RHRHNADAIDAVIASYKKLHTKDLSLPVINRHINDLLPLIGWESNPPQISLHLAAAIGDGTSKGNKEMTDDAIQLIEEENADAFDQTGGVPTTQPDDKDVEDAQDGADSAGQDGATGQDTDSPVNP